jgi:ketosteroid isomerase-like protein
MDHAETVRNLYAAFGRGDIDFIIEHLAPDVQWDCDRAPNDVPWLQGLSGRHEVPKFFAALAEHCELRRFEPQLILQSGDTVLATFAIDGYARRTGKRMPETLGVHVWTFDAAGRVASYKNAVDSYGASQSLRAG